jgi:hypothetical protein
MAGQPRVCKICGVIDECVKIFNKVHEKREYGTETEYQAYFEHFCQSGRSTTGLGITRHSYGAD